MCTIHWLLSKINNTLIDKTKYVDVVMPMYNLTEYSDNYSKTSGGLWLYYRDNKNDNITQSEWFKYKINRKTGKTGKTHAADNKKDFRIAVPLKYLGNCYRTLEKPLINCETNLILTWSDCCVISSALGETKFKITDTKL